MIPHITLLTNKLAVLKCLRYFATGCSDFRNLSLANEWVEWVIYVSSSFYPPTANWPTRMKYYLC